MAVNINGSYLQNVRMGLFANAPAASSQSATSGAEGDPITVTGTNLQDAISVTFPGDVPATITFNDATTLIFDIPAGGGGGAIHIITPNGEFNIMLDVVPPSNTLQLYHFDTYTTDIDGNTLIPNAVGTENITIGAGEPIVISTSVHEFGIGSLEMDGGTSGSSSFPTLGTLSTAWTFEFSTRWNYDGGSGGVLFRLPSSQDIEFNNENASLYRIYFGETILTATVGEWTQWAMVIDIVGNTYKIFKNGVLSYSSTAAIWPGAAFDLTVSIGRGGYNYNYGNPIYLDEARISNAALYSATYTPSVVPFAS